MDIFYNHLFGLGLAALLILLFFGIYRWASARLISANTGGQAVHGSQAAVSDCGGLTIWRSVKSLRREFLPDLKEAVVRNNQACRKLVTGCFSKRVITNAVLDVVLVGLISLFMANVASAKDGGLDLYMSTFIPMMGVMLLLFWVTEALCANRILAFSSAMLIIVGMCLQVMLRLPASAPTDASELVIFAMVSVIFGIVMLPVIRLVCCEMRKDHVLILLHLVLIALYLVLLPTEGINGTRAWITVGGFSLQLTELTKVLSCAIFAMEFTREDVYVRSRKKKRPADFRKLRSDRRLWDALVTLGINGVFLLICNELGTLCVLGLVFFVMAMIYLDSIQKLLVMVLICCVLVAAVLGVCLVCYNIRHPAEDAESAQTTQTTEPAEESEETDGEASGENKSLVDKMIDLGEKIYKKFKIRMDLIFHPETVDPYREGYQTTRARKAILLSGWLGSEYEVSIPVVSSDFIFAYLIMKMGMLFGLVALTMMLLMLCLGFVGCLRNSSTLEAALGLAFLLSITLQSLLAAASATNQFIMIGLPFAFVAEGGTASVMNYTMLLFVLFVTRTKGAQSHRRTAVHGRHLERKEG